MTSSSKDLVKLKEYLQKNKIISFDIIIDDGSHILSNILKNSRREKNGIRNEKRIGKSANYD